MKLKICMILLALFVSSMIFTLNLKAQFNSKYEVGLGIITTQILGDNPAKLPIISTSDSTDAVTGGSFPMLQPGIELRFTFPLDDNNNFRIPLSFDYTFFRGKERMNYNRKIVDYFSHTLNVLGINTGFHYAFLSIPVVRAKIYTGLEVRLSYIHNIDVEWYRDYLEAIFPDETYKYKTKPSVVRLGGAYKLGIEGRLNRKVYINTGASLMFTNLIGKDDSRGELFTPITMFEKKESLVYNFQLFILIQYNL
jgi:hypothetical protein